MIDLATVTADDFEMLTDRQFDCPELPVVLTLTEVRRGRPQPDARAPFALTLVGPAEPALESRIQLLHHATMGDLELFLTPVSANAGSRTYEAVFG